MDSKYVIISAPLLTGHVIQRWHIAKKPLHNGDAECWSGVEKMVFKVLVFYGFLKNQKISKGRIFWFFMVFLDIVVFCINYTLKPYRIIISLL